MRYEHPEGEPVVDLPLEESWRLLRHTRHGRLAVSVAGEPDIMPINFGASEDRRLFFRTAPGTKLAGLTVNESVAFEADGVLGDEAWSVVVRGNARVLETREELEAARSSGVDPWVPTLKEVWVEIQVGTVTGRHFALGAQPEAEEQV